MRRRARKTRSTAETLAVVTEVFRWAERTGRAFDPTVLPLVRAWDLRGEGRVASSQEIDGALAAMGASRFRIDPDHNTIARLDARAGIDEGAWGKGYALDRAAARLKAAGVADAWLDLGGEVLALGKGSDAGPWTVPIAHPRDRRRPAALLALPDGLALSTSGDSERSRRVGGRTIGHLLDPRTGSPAPDFGSVCVVADSGFVADVLSTAFFVLGPRRWARAFRTASRGRHSERGALSRRQGRGSRGPAFAGHVPVSSFHRPGRRDRRQLTGGRPHEFSRNPLADASLLLALALSVALPAQTPPTPAPEAPLSPEERLKRLEKLLAETRADLDAMKAAPADAATQARLAEVERKIDVLAQEIEKIKIGEAAAVVPAPSTARSYGVGPAAAKVYGKDGLSIGGYGEVTYQNFAEKNQSGEPSDAEDQITVARAVLYLDTSSIRTSSSIPRSSTRTPSSPRTKAARRRSSSPTSTTCTRAPSTAARGSC